MGRDQVGLDPVAPGPKARCQVVLPEGGVPPDEVVAAPDVVDQDVEPAALLALDPGAQGVDLGGVEVVAADRHPAPPGRVHEGGGLLDRLGRPSSERAARVERPVT